MFARHFVAFVCSLLVAGGLFVGAAQAQNVSVSQLLNLFISMRIIPAEKAQEARTLVRDMGLDQPIPDHTAMCPQISRTLTLGATGSDVTTLQETLAQDATLYPEGLVTGYFGPLTQKAVQNYQARAGIVSSGDPQSTGFGLVGPKTRAALAGCVALGGRPTTPTSGTGVPSDTVADTPAPPPPSGSGTPGGPTPPPGSSSAGPGGGGPDSGSIDDEEGGAPPPPPPPPPPSL